MEKVRKNKINRLVAAPTLVIWYLWSIMLVCFSQSLIGAEATFDGPSEQDSITVQASVMHKPGACDAQVSIDVGSSYCETGIGPSVASDLLQLEIAALQIAWDLVPGWYDTVALPTVTAILTIPTLQIFLQICSFLK